MDVLDNFYKTNCFLLIFDSLSFSSRVFLLLYNYFCGLRAFDCIISPSEKIPLEICDQWRYQGGNKRRWPSNDMIKVMKVKEHFL